MKMKDAFPNLKFVGKNAEQFKNSEITEEQLANAEKWEQRGFEFGKRFFEMSKFRNSI